MTTQTKPATHFHANDPSTFEPLDGELGSEGAQAYQRGDSIDCNPYDEGTEEYEDWREQWNDAERDSMSDAEREAMLRDEHEAQYD